MRRLRQEMGWPLRERELSQISDDTLDIVVRNLLSLSRNFGQQMVLGLSEDEVSSYRETELGSLIFRVDPVSSVLRRFRTAQRRAYNVTRPNAL